MGHCPAELQDPLARACGAQRDRSAIPEAEGSSLREVWALAEAPAYLSGRYHVGGSDCCLNSHCARAKKRLMTALLIDSMHTMKLSR